MKYSVKTQIICRNNSALCPIRMRVSYSGIRVDIRLGVSVPAECWNADKEIAQTRSAKYKDICNEANIKIHDTLSRIDELFAKCDLVDKRLPSTDEIKACSNCRLRGNRLSDAVRLFKIENPHLESNTIKNYNSMLTNVVQEKGDIYLNDITKDVMAQLVFKFSKRMKNSTIFVNITRLRTILLWAQKKKDYTGDGLDYQFKLKRIPRVIVYLTRDELLALFNYIPESKNEKIAQLLYCFCAFTGLRYSDTSTLKWDNIKDDRIELITKKTSSSLIIELNKYSREVLERAKEFETKNNLVFPNLAFCTYEKELKDIARKLEINELITYTYYKGGERVSESKEKWNFVTSHTARKTFVVNAISLKIPLEVVMRWTGHKSLKNIEPYLKIVDEVKRNNMDKFDSI